MSRTPSPNLSGSTSPPPGCKHEFCCVYFTCIFFFQESLKKVLQEKLEAIQKLTEIEVRSTDENKFFKLVFRQDCRPKTMVGSRDGTVVRALASHQCGPGLILARGHMWALLVVDSRLAPRVQIQPS